MDDAVEYEAPIKLSTISATELEDIEAIDTVQPLSAKSDVVVKHVKYLRRQNPANKIVVFSAWTESLAVRLLSSCRAGQADLLCGVRSSCRLSSAMGSNTFDSKEVERRSRPSRASSRTPPLLLSFSFVHPLASSKTSADSVDVQHTKSQAAGLNLTW